MRPPQITIGYTQVSRKLLSTRIRWYVRIQPSKTQICFNTYFYTSSKAAFWDVILNSILNTYWSEPRPDTFTGLKIMVLVASTRIGRKWAWDNYNCFQKAVGRFSYSVIELLVLDHCSRFTSKIWNKFYGWNLFACSISFTVLKSGSNQTQTLSELLDIITGQYA